MKVRKRVLSFMTVMVMVLTLMFGGITVQASDATQQASNAASVAGLQFKSSSPLTNLVYFTSQGVYTHKNGNDRIYDFKANRYKLSDGGYVLYGEVWTDSALGGTYASGDLFKSNYIDNMTQKAKQDFASDVFTIANAVIDDGENGELDANAATYGKSAIPTSETGTSMMEVMSQQGGMATTMLAAVMQNTKPDYVTANRLYAPFSGVVGTILGLAAILIIALLGVSMALDLAYINIPAFQMALGGEGGGQGGQGGGNDKGWGRIISMEAHKAVQAADGGAGGSGQGGAGDYKAATGTYFKYRWKGLIFLGICLLYLVQGQIYGFVGWFIDLFSGFLGF